jgi:acetyl esterase/lipase
MDESQRSRPPINRLARAVMRLFAAPRINMREDYERVRRLQRHVAQLPLPGPRVPFREVTVDSAGHPIHCRVFEPLERRRDDVLLFFHGGGWVTGDIASYTPACATMAELTGCTVVSVDYRLAPEHPFPAGLEDCLHITRLLLTEPHRVGADSADRIVLVGDSAGGNLAAVVSQQLRDEGGPTVGRQILLYPVTHWDHDPATSPFESVRAHGRDYRLTTLEVEDYFCLYVPDRDDRRDPRVAPLLAEDLSDQPRTLVISAELDLLCDEGEAYGRALAHAGNDVRIERVPGALHGFITLPRFSKSLRHAYTVIDEFLDGTPTDPPHTTDPTPRTDEPEPQGAA